jgi:hypothetical protein
VDTALTTAEQAELDRHEAIIAAGKETFMSVGLALMAIQDNQLYRAGYTTFADYCKLRWNMSRQQGYRLIAAAQVALEMSPIGTIPNAYQARILGSLPEHEDKARALQLAQTTANQLAVPVTSSIIRAAVETIEEHQATGGYVSIDEHQVESWKPTPVEVASVINKASEIVQRQSQHKNGVRLDSFEGPLADLEHWSGDMAKKHGSDKRVRLIMFEANNEPAHPTG